MRQTRIDKRRRPVRARHYTDEASSWNDALDPRDPDVVRAKRLRLEREDGTDRP